MAEYSIEPWGEWRLDRAAAQVTAMVGNGAGGKRGGGTFATAEFMPKWEAVPTTPKPSRPKWQEDRDKFRAYAVLRGGVVNGKSMRNPHERGEHLKQMILKGEV